MNRKDLQELSRVRLAEATALFKLRLFDGAYYLAGYSVECALKACIAKRTLRGEFPDLPKARDSYSHDFRQLVRTAGLEDLRVEQAAINKDFARNWDAACVWSEQTRYRRNSAHATTILLKAISARQNGVMSWVKQQW